MECRRGDPSLAGVPRGVRGAAAGAARGPASHLFRRAKAPVVALLSVHICTVTNAGRYRSCPPDSARSGSADDFEEFDGRQEYVPALDVAAVTRYHAAAGKVGEWLLAFEEHAFASQRLRRALRADRALRKELLEHRGPVGAAQRQEPCAAG